MTFGTSSRHGPHQLAKKSTSTTLPRYESQSNSEPSSSVPSSSSLLPGRRRTMPSKSGAMRWISESLEA